MILRYRKLHNGRHTAILRKKAEGKRIRTIGLGLAEACHAALTALHDGRCIKIPAGAALFRDNSLPLGIRQISFLSKGGHAYKKQASHQEGNNSLFHRNPPFIFSFSIAKAFRPCKHH